MPQPLGKILPHDRDATLDYGFRWRLAAGETIVDSQWDVVAGTATLGDEADDSAPAATGKSGSVVAVAGLEDTYDTIVWVVTASPGPVHVRNRITTSAGRRDDRTGPLLVRDL